METLYQGFGGGWRRRGLLGDDLATTTTVNTPVGALTVDLFDSSNKQLIW
jgi:hypothetical protein